MRIIVTGATGMVGEGVLLQCLETDEVEKVLSVSRKQVDHAHPKLEQLIVSDFRDLAAVEAQLAGYDACFFCAGVSSIGMSEAEYTAVTYDTTIAFATTLARLNPTMVFTYVTGQGTDSSEKGRTMWARVKGRTENALGRLPFKGVYNFRPGLMTPKPGQKHLKRSYRIGLVFAPVLKLFFRALTLEQVGRAMLRCASTGAPTNVLEVRDIAALATVEK